MDERIKQEKLYEALKIAGEARYSISRAADLASCTDRCIQNFVTKVTSLEWAIDKLSDDGLDSFIEEANVMKAEADEFLDMARNLYDDHVQYCNL